MAKNFYNLPNAWNPGYVDPGSVLDEGLERRAFITAMTPRGTYDDPSVSNGGYDVPRYIDDEGYGQGAFVTKWLPRGYYGPAIPNYLDQTFSRIVAEQPLPSGTGVVLKMETLGDDAPGYVASSAGARDPFQAFGQRSAAALIASVKRLPQHQREAAMKRAMDAMDPSLYQRTRTFTERLRARGMKPRPALAHGLAAGVTEGMLAELARAGARRSAPQARSLPGLGCYGCAAALGAITVASSNVGAAVAQNQAAIAAQIAGGAKTVVCPGYTWTGSSWSRLKAGQDPNSGNPGPAGSCPVPTTGGTGTTVSGGGSVSSAPKVGQMAQIGPWVFPLAGGTIRSHLQSVPSSWASFLGAQLRLGGSKFSNIQWGKTATITSKYAQVDGSLVGLSGKVGVLTAQVNGSMPVVKVKHPTTGETWGLFLSDLGQSGSGSFTLRFAKVDYGWLASAFNWIAWVVAVVIDVVKDAVEAVADLACSLVQQPGATAAAAAASGGTAAVGVALTAGICKTPEPVPIPPPPASASDYTVPILIGGALAAGVVLFAKKKKAS